jgi:CcmD family protein
MSATTSIVLAYCAVFLGLGGYAAWLLANSARLKRREQQLELLDDDTK